LYVVSAEAQKLHECGSKHVSLLGASALVEGADRQADPSLHAG
jgi:hypothetical protein